MAESLAEPTATGRVYDAVYSAILEGRLTPGVRLREVELAASSAVSRTVVRQALQRLAQDQLVDLQHNRGAQVMAPTAEAAAHVFDARRVVECDVARRLGGRLSEPQLSELRALLAAFERSGAAAAAEMRRHLVEVERSLAPRDAFARYREAADSG